jgi:hypothetical protein
VKNHEHLKKLAVWDVVTRTRNIFTPDLYKATTVEVAEVVPTNIHPKWFTLIGRALTHEEATAIAKMFNSGELHGTN